MTTSSTRSSSSAHNGVGHMFYKMDVSCFIKLLLFIIYLIESARFVISLLKHVVYQGRILAEIRGGQCLLSKYRYPVSIRVLMLEIKTQVSVPIQSKCVCRVSIYIEMKFCILSDFLDNYFLYLQYNYWLMERNKFSYYKIFQTKHFLFIGVIYLTLEYNVH